ncbi:MAG: hypothetical protein AAB802_00880, partial [Patescibacteria group bacterium]
MSSEFPKNRIDEASVQPPNSEQNQLKPYQARTWDEIKAAANLELIEAGKKFIENLLDDPEDGYEAWMDFLTTKVLTLETLRKDDVAMPTKEEALAFLTEKFTPEQIEFLTNPRYVSKPKFIMVPGVSVDRLVPSIGVRYGRDLRRLASTDFVVMDEDSEERMQNADYNESADDRIKYWQVGIVESARAAQTLPDEPTHYDLGGRDFWFDQHFGVNGI